MTEAQIALARRAVAAPGWRWLPGMLTACRVRVHECGPDYIIGHRPGPTKDGGGMVDTMDLSGFVPDLSDPLTALGLLALVREQLKMPDMSPVRSGRIWFWMNGGGHNPLWQHTAESELELLVLALR